MPDTVFLSYARDDGADLAVALRDELRRRNISAYMDLDNLYGDERWRPQLKDAIDGCNVLVLLATPKALQSEACAWERETARRYGKRVFAVQVPSDVKKLPPFWKPFADKIAACATDFSAMPRHLSARHYYNLVEQEDAFFRDVQKDWPPFFTPHESPAVQEHVVPRPDLLEPLVALLVEPGKGHPVALTTAYAGGGGFGKTTLAMLACADERVRRAFEDGIYWVELGETPNIEGVLADLLTRATGAPPQMQPGRKTLDVYQDALAAALTDTATLLVIDDVWDAAHAAPFLAGEGAGARQLTTRWQDIARGAVGSGMTQLDVRDMNPALGAQVLLYWLAELPKDQHPSDVTPFQAFAHELGGWPLLLTFAAQWLSDAVLVDGDAPLDALANLRTRLAGRSFTLFDRGNEGDRHKAVSTSLGVSVDRVAARAVSKHGIDDAAQRFAELAIFPEDTDISAVQVARLWSATATLDAHDTDDLWRLLGRASLFLRYDPKRARLHDPSGARRATG